MNKELSLFVPTVKFNYFYFNKKINKNIVS